jgi:hypothetical protein
MNMMVRSSVMGVLMVGWAGLASAQGGASICSRISSDSQAAACTAAVAGQRVDQSAVSICNRISSDSQIVACARAVAGRSMAASANQLCNRVSSDSQIVACASGVAGHSLDARAVGACNRVSSDSQIAACGLAIASKTYAPEEIDLCNRSSSDSAIVTCLRTTGRAAVAPQYGRPAGYGYAAPPPPRDPYAVPPPPPRDPYALPPPPPPQPTYYPPQPAPTAWVTLDNMLYQAPIVRVYYRLAGQRGGWSENVLQTAIYPGQHGQVLIPQGAVDLCAELPDGTSGRWENRQLTNVGMRLSIQGDVNDPNKFDIRRPCRKRDRAY